MVNKSRPALQVPLFYQPCDHSCVPTCLKMLLAYYGRRRSLAQLDAALRRAKTSGVSFSVAGTYLLGLGYDVRVYDWRPEFPNSFLDLGARDSHHAYLSWFKRRLRNGTLPDIECMFGHQKFIDAGGLFLPRPCRPNELKSALTAGIPPIVGVNTGLLWRNREKTISHAILLRGIDGQGVEINDSYREFGGQRQHDLDRFLFAYHQDNGCALIARPKD